MAGILGPLVGLLEGVVRLAIRLWCSYHQEVAASGACGVDVGQLSAPWAVPVVWDGRLLRTHLGLVGVVAGQPMCFAQARVADRAEDLSSRQVDQHGGFSAVRARHQRRPTSPTLGLGI